MRKIGMNNADIQDSNRSAVLRILAGAGVLTRVELSRMTGLKQATITNIVRDLLEFGVISEIGMLKGNMGRRTIGIVFNADKYRVLGIKVARRSFSIGAFNIRNELIAEYHESIDKGTDARQVLDTVTSEARALINAHGEVCAIGVAVPGPYLEKEGRIALMSESVGWEKINIQTMLSKAFDQPVFIEHDANAGAMAEWQVRSDLNKVDVLVHLLASEGIGAGVVINGKILRGHRGFFGEVGHMSINALGNRCACGNYGCLETYCSALAFAKQVEMELPKHPESSLQSEINITAEVIFEHMRRADPFSIESVERVGSVFGYGIANIVNIYDPKEIVITDLMSGGGAILLHSIEETIKERILPEARKDLVIRYSNLTEDTILYGAASVAIDRILDRADVFFNAIQNTSDDA